jgi:hypothetical protein
MSADEFREPLRATRLNLLHDGGVVVQQKRSPPASPGSVFT